MLVRLLPPPPFSPLLLLSVLLGWRLLDAICCRPVLYLDGLNALHRLQFAAHVAPLTVKSISHRLARGNLLSALCGASGKNMSGRLGGTGQNCRPAALPATSGL